MSAMVKVIDPEDIPVLLKYFGLDGGNQGVVLVMPNVAKACDVKNGYVHGYDFGGEPDIVIDIVSRPDHWFLLKEES